MFTYWLLQPLLLFALLHLISLVSGFNGRCPTGWSYFDDHCYRLENTYLSFIAAQTTCESFDASLVSITSAEENQFVTDLGITGQRSFYIGLNDFQASEGTFRWMDGTPFRYDGPSYAVTCDQSEVGGSRGARKYCKGNEIDFSNWNKKEPNNAGENSNSEDCVHIIYDTETPSKIGLWNDILCNAKLKSICKKDASEEGTHEETTIKCPHSFETFIELGTSLKSVSWYETPYLANSLASHVERSHAPGVELPKGETLVNYAFRDAFDRSVTCNFTITIIEVDTTPPYIDGCPPDLAVVKYPDVPLRVDWIPPTASDLSGNLTLLSQSHTPGDSFDFGKHFINYTFADGEGNEAVCTFTMHVFIAVFANKVDTQHAQINPNSSRICTQCDQINPATQHTQINPDPSSTQHVQMNPGSSCSRGNNLIAGLYFIIIIFGLTSSIMLLVLIRNRNAYKTMPFSMFSESKSYSNMVEENLTN